MNRKNTIQKLSLIFSLLFIFTIISPIIQSVPPVSSTTYIVDINGSGDFTSIKEAIENTNPTDIIRIKEGNYYESNIIITDKISIIGENPENTIIDCLGQNGIIIDGSYIDISGLKITNTYEHAIYVREEADYCSISDCIIQPSENKEGIWIRASSTLISNVEINGNRTAAQGIKINGNNNRIINSDIYSCRTGILILIDISNNEVTNCNLFNNYIALEMRIRSSNNLVTNCNIYSNTYGVNIIIDSHENAVYLNNFWKNDYDATDDHSNNWDNGESGNYWDDYNGNDNNGDGIGDSPYTISTDANDNYPIIDFILPDEVSTPSDIRLISKSWDDTPEFSWGPSYYTKSVIGYQIRIDNNPVTNVGDILSWTSTEQIENGVHTFYVRAIGSDDTYSNWGSLEFSINTLFIDSDEDGWSDDEEQQYGTDPDDKNNYPLDTDGDRIPNTEDSDDDNDGYSDDMELSYGRDTTNANNYPVDTDKDYIPNENSPDGKYTGDADDDDDGISDTIEKEIGSNPLDNTDGNKIYIAGNAYYLIDVNSDDIYEILYNPETTQTTAVEKSGETYLIDISGDESWDYTYTITDGVISEYEGIPPLTIIAVFLAIILAGLSIYYLLKYLRKRPIKIRAIIGVKPKRTRRPKPAKPIRLPPMDTETVMMLSQTKDLLQNIQNNVQIYMDKLSQLEDQMKVTKKEKEPITIAKEPEKEKIIPEIIDEPKKEVTKETKKEPKKEKTKDLDIESEVDKLLNKLDDYENT
jgi:hypothetical protein